jgi:hypothetical protein
VHCCLWPLAVVTVSSVICCSYSSVAEVQLGVYGADGDPVVFPALDCVVAEAHLVINCTTAPGAGPGLSWTVSIGNQTSQAPVTAYAPPVLTSVVLSAGAVCSLFKRVLFCVVSVPSCVLNTLVPYPPQSVLAYCISLAVSLVVFITSAHHVSVRVWCRW